jgi:hypothetical protein
MRRWQQNTAARELRGSPAHSRLAPAQDDDVVSVLDEVAARQLEDLLLVDRGLVAEVEGLQRLDEGETRHGRAHDHVLAGLGGHLFAEDLFQEVGVGGIVGRGLLQQRFQAFPAL